MLALPLLNLATLILAGHPWTITWAYALWGAKAAVALGFYLDELHALGGRLSLAQGLVSASDALLALADQTLWVTALIAGPVLIATLVVGLVVGIIQAATSGAFVSSK